MINQLVYVGVLILIVLLLGLVDGGPVRLPRLS